MRISFANGTRRLYILPIANRAGTNSRLWNERQIRAFCQEAPTEKLPGLKICMSRCPAAGWQSVGVTNYQSAGFANYR